MGNNQYEQPKQKDDVTIPIRISKREKAFLQEIAVLSGKTLPEYLRSVAIEQAKKVLKE